MHRPDEDDEHDAAVIARSLRRPEWFATIVDRHAAHSQRHLARGLGGQVADDLVAETFLVAFGKRAGYDRARRTRGRGCTASRRTSCVGTSARRPANTGCARPSRRTRTPAGTRPGRGPGHGGGHAPPAGRGTRRTVRRGPRRAAADRLGGPHLRGGRRCARDPRRTVRSRLNRARKQVRAALTIPTSKGSANQG